MLANHAGVQLVGAGRTNGIGDLSHGIVAHIEVAEAFAFDEAMRQSIEEVVGEGESAERVSMCTLDMGVVTAQRQAMR